MERIELADFLRRRREALQPDDVGLAGGPRRRATGLRREEVAALSGMSTDTYSRMEQRRGAHPSEQMLAALARGLRLTLDERDHLFRLAGHAAPRRPVRLEHVSPGLMRILDRLDDTPAMLVTAFGETVVQNRLAAALLGDHARYFGPMRSAVVRWFTDPDERRIYPERDHDHQSRVQVAQLRVAVGRVAGSDDPVAAHGRQIVRHLTAKSPAFTDIWSRHEVIVKTDQYKTIVHPELGEIELDCQLLISDDQPQILLVFTASPGTEGHEKLKLLSVIGTQRMSDVPPLSVRL